jgi:hypothetical protein
MTGRPVYKNFIYLEERNFIFAYVPKVACTNWKSLMRYMVGCEDWLDNKRAHDKVAGGLRYLDLQGPDVKLVSNPDIKKYSMVRDPYSRILSAYLNKVESRLPVSHNTREDEFTDIVRNIDSFRRKELDVGEHPRISFRVFLLWLRDSGSWQTRNEHWAAQTRLLMYPETKFDFIGRFENLEEDSAHMLKEMGCTQRFPSQEEVRFAPTGAQSKVAQYYTPVELKLVKELFTGDFEAFGYQYLEENENPEPEPPLKRQQIASITSASPTVHARDSGHDSALHIQAAIDYAVERGGGRVSLSAGTFHITRPIVLHSRVILEGQGAGTVLRLADNVNAAVVESERFDSLTGTNSWFAVRESVPIAFGLRALTIDGNWENNVGAPGVRFYGKRYTVRDVAIRETSGVGFYSECGDQVGQDGPDDMPECIVDGLWVSRTRSHGVHFRGPHDGILNNVLVSRARGKGIFTQYKKGTFDGSCDADMWHAYACWDVGVQINAKISCGTRLIGENCAKEGIVIGATRACNLSTLSSFDANNPDIMRMAQIGPSKRTFNVRIESGFHTINGLRIYDRRQSLGGLLIERHQTCINGLIADGHGNGGTGVEVRGGQNSVSGVVSNFYGRGGSGLVVHPEARLNYSNLNINNCALAVTERGQTVGNQYVLRVRLERDQSVFIDGPPDVSTNTIQLFALRNNKMEDHMSFNRNQKRRWF